MIVVISKKIRSIRKAKNCSQEEIAEKLGMSVSGYSKIERGETRPDVQKLKKIADVLNVDLTELLSDSHDDNNHIDSNDISFEMEKLKMELLHKDEVIYHQKQEIAHLKHIVKVIECRLKKRHPVKMEAGDASLNQPKKSS